jgi:FkbM family methyltransferase
LKQFAGWYFPDHEKHLLGWLSHPKNTADVEDGRVMYQGKKLKAALAYCEKFRTAVDIGAHCGTWSYYLSKRFKKVHAFEPVLEHRECFALNVPNDNVTLHPCAIGAEEGMIAITTEPTSSGDSRVNGSGDIPMYTLDSFNLKQVDFIKIDTEGYELFAVRGAEQTIKRCRPVMVVEQKGHGVEYFGFRKEEAVELLQSWGMTPLQAPMSGDWIMGWPKTVKPFVPQDFVPQEFLADAEAALADIQANADEFK